MHRDQQFDPWSPQNKREREMLACNLGNVEIDL